jgi:hypothetical protein
MIPSWNGRGAGTRQATANLLFKKFGHLGRHTQEETMITAAIVLTTPMMLATEPVSFQMPDRFYSHNSQTSTYKGRVAAGTTMGTMTGGGGAGYKDKDTQVDYW